MTTGGNDCLVCDSQKLKMKGVNYEGRYPEEKVIEKRLPFSAFSSQARRGELFWTSGIEPDVAGRHVGRIGGAQL